MPKVPTQLGLRKGTGRTDHCNEKELKNIDDYQAEKAQERLRDKTIPMSWNQWTGSFHDLSHPQR
jgi:hypothetical protein